MLKSLILGESDTSEMYLINELAKKLAEKIHKGLDETNNLQPNYLLENDNISDRYTLKYFKSRCSIFQESKEFYGSSAQGW